MNPDFLWGPLILLACAAALVALAPAALRAARTAYAESVEDSGTQVSPPQQPDTASSPRRIRPSDDPVWPIRPAA